MDSWMNVWLVYPLEALLVSSSLVAQTVKRLPTMQETWVRSLGGEDPLEKEMATYSTSQRPLLAVPFLAYSPMPSLALLAGRRST